MIIHPTTHELSEWQRLATDAYKLGRNSYGHRFSAAAAIYAHGCDIETFDRLQDDYRQWLIAGFPQVQS